MAKSYFSVVLAGEHKDERFVNVKKTSMLEIVLSKLNDSHKSLNNPTLSSLNTPTSSREETNL